MRYQNEVVVSGFGMLGDDTPRTVGPGAAAPTSPTEAVTTVAADQAALNPANHTPAFMFPFLPRPMGLPPHAVPPRPGAFTQAVSLRTTAPVPDAVRSPLRVSPQVVLPPRRAQIYNPPVPPAPGHGVVYQPRPLPHLPAGEGAVPAVFTRRPPLNVQPGGSCFPTTQTVSRAPPTSIFRAPPAAPGYATPQEVPCKGVVLPGVVRPPLVAPRDPRFATLRVGPFAGLGGTNDDSILKGLAGGLAVAADSMGVCRGVGSLGDLGALGTASVAQPGTDCPPDDGAGGWARWCDCMYTKGSDAWNHCPRCSSLPFSSCTDPATGNSPTGDQKALFAPWTIAGKLGIGGGPLPGSGGGGGGGTTPGGSTSQGSGQTTAPAKSGGMLKWALILGGVAAAVGGGAALLRKKRA